MAGLNGLVFELLAAGITPVLAHPERHTGLRKCRQAVPELVGRGCAVQITAFALLGIGGWFTRRYCEWLLRDGLVSAVASDAHRPQDFETLPRALDRAKKLIGPRADRLFAVT
jgi:protein-tyrosine phosphatase